MSMLYSSCIKFPPYAGVKVVSDAGKLKWPAHKMNGICGDAYNQNKWDKPGKISTVYKQGDTITIDLLFAQNHLGRINMRLCPLNAKTEKECINLSR